MTYTPTCVEVKIHKVNLHVMKKDCCIPRYNILTAHWSRQSLDIHQHEQSLTSIGTQKVERK